ASARPPASTRRRRVSSARGRATNAAPDGAAPARAASGLAEVRLANLLVRLQRGRVVGEDDAPRLEHVAAVRRVERHQRVLLDEQDRRPLLVDLLDDVEDSLDEDRREPG